MKKTLRTILAGAVALLAVSCYDDSDLRNKYGDLNDRVTAIESTLNAEVGGINDLLARVETLEGKVAAIKVETVDGVTTLTLSDESSVVLSKNGVLTVVDGGWATVAPDGTVTPLGVKVNHELDFKVENGELKYAPKGETNFTATGVKISTYTAHVIGNVVKAEDGKSVAITIGDQTFELPLVSSAVATLGLSRENFFLRYEGEKVVSITAENLSDIYVMNQPDGWNATIEDDELTITSPTKKAIEIGAAQAEGLVLVHATTEEGKCVVAKLEVTAGPGLTLAVDAKGNLTIENSFTSTKVNMWGETSFGFDGIVFGFATPEEFLADPEAYVNYYNSNWQAPSWDDIIFPSIYNAVEEGVYVEGQYETDVIKTTLDDVYNVWFYEEIPAGAHYIIWAAPQDATKQGAAIIEDMVYVEYIKLVHEVEAVATHNDVTITANVAGASSYIVGLAAETEYNDPLDPKTFEEYMNAPLGGKWNGFKQYGALEALGIQIPAEQMPESFKISELFGEYLAFGANYKIWIMPLLAHKSKLDESASMPEFDYYVYDNSAYDFEADFLPYVIDIKTADVTAGAPAPTLSLASATFDTINVDVTLDETTQVLYYEWYTMEDYGELSNMDEKDKVKQVVADCSTALNASGKVSENYLNPADERMLVAVAISADAKYSLVEEKYSTLPVPKSSDLTVTKVSFSEVEGKCVVEVAVTGASKVMGYAVTANDSNLASFFVNVAKNGHKASYSGFEMADVVDGKATLTFTKSSYKPDYMVAALNVTDGVVSAVSEQALVLNIETELAPAN